MNYREFMRTSCTTISMNYREFMKNSCTTSSMTYREFMRNSCTTISMNYWEFMRTSCTVNGKINGTSKCVHLPISNLHSILVVANLPAHNNININYYMQINSPWLKSNVASKWASEHLLRVPFILMLTVPQFL